VAEESGERNWMSRKQPVWQVPCDTRREPCEHLLSPAKNHRTDGGIASCKKFIHTFQLRETIRLSEYGNMRQVYNKFYTRVLIII